MEKDPFLDHDLLSDLNLDDFDLDDFLKDSLPHEKPSQEPKEELVPDEDGKTFTIRIPHKKA